MDRDQAKEILLGYQRGRDDAIDARLREALALVDRDPELASWFELQQRADDAIRAGLRETPVPAGLKQKIVGEQKIVRVVFAWRRSVWLAAAAAVVVLGLVSALFYRDRVR